MKYFIFLALFLSACGRGTKEEDAPANKQKSDFSGEYEGCHSYYVFNAKDDSGNKAKVLVKVIKPQDYNLKVQIRQGDLEYSQYTTGKEDAGYNYALFSVTMNQQFTITCLGFPKNGDVKKIGKRQLQTTIEKGKFSTSSHPGCLGFANAQQHNIYFLEPTKGKKMVVRRNEKIIFQSEEGRRTDDEQFYFANTFIYFAPLDNQKSVYTCTMVQDNIEEKGAYSLKF